MTNQIQFDAKVRPAIHAMRQLFEENREGGLRGIYSVCSANRLVLEAAFAQATNDESLLLIEATCNQVNQDGGYTGLTPVQFRDYVHTVAKESNFAAERLILRSEERRV